MTDDDLDPRDELASAHLDEATTPSEADAVASDPEVAARVAAFAATRDALRATAGQPVDEDRREVAIAAALDAFAGTGAAVVPLAPRRAAVRRQWLPLVGVAAAALLAAVLIPLLARDDAEEPALAKDDATTTMAGPGDASGAAGAARSQEESILAAPADDGTMDMSVMTLTVDLGEQPDLDALAAAARAHLAAPPTTVVGTPPTTAPPAATQCFDQLREAAAQAGLGDVTLLEATASLAGGPVAAVVRQREDRQVLVVVSLDGCSPVAEVEL